MLWLTWGDPSDQPLGAHGKVLGNGSSSTATLQVSDNTTLQYSCAISELNLTSIGASDDDPPVASRFQSYAPGDYWGDKLDDLYNIGGSEQSNRLVNGIWFALGQATFKVSCTATISVDGGAPQPHDIRGFVIGDAEATADGGDVVNPFEFVGGAAAGNWTIVEVRKNPTTTDPYYANKYTQNGLNYLRFGPGNDTTAAVSFVTFNTPSPNAEMYFAVKGGGAQAIAIGVLAPFADYSDAPQSYGAAWHIVQEFTLSPDGIPNSTIGAGSVDVNAPGYQPGALVPPTSDFLGTKAPDIEQAAPFSADARGDDAFPDFNTTEENAWPASPEISALQQGAAITRDIACAGTGTVAGWIDFDINGTFDDDERAVAQCTGGLAQLSWTAPADIKSGPSFVRLRYATIASQVLSPTGVADDGEAEDHAITIAGPALSITKTSNAANGVWAVNQPDAQYSLTVENTGSVASGTGTEQIVVLDTLPPGIVAGWAGTLSTNGWSCAVTGQDIRCETNQVLAAAGSAGSTSTIVLPVTIPESFVGTTATNYASVAGGRDPFNNGVPPVPGATCTDAAHCASHTVTIDAQPELTIEKTADWNDLDGDNLLALNDEIVYRFKVTNTGLVTMTNITVTDTLPGIVITGTPIASLAPGAFDDTSYTATYRVTQADVESGSVTNVATATGTPPSGTPIDSPPSSVTVPPDQRATLSITKRFVQLIETVAPAGPSVGDIAEFAFDVTNTGVMTLTDVTINESLAQATVSGVIASLAPGATDSTITARYALTQADIDAGEVENTAFARGNPPTPLTPVDSDPSTVITPLAVTPSLAIVKSGTYVDTNGDGYSSAGDTLEYRFEITNDGVLTMTDVTPVDAGPQFDGVAGLASLSAFSPAPVTLAPGASQVFTATYVMTNDDAARAGGKPDAVFNEAAAQGITLTGAPFVTAPVPAVLSLPAPQTTDISLVKVALTRQIRRGEEALFRIEVTNNAPGVATGVTLTDTVPAGFRYVENSATLDGAPIQPLAAGPNPSFGPLQLNAGQTVALELRVLALASATPGTHINLADAYDPSGNKLTTQAEASFYLLPEAVFDCSEIIGKVFDDRNQNGYQDSGETGLPAVRLATGRGVLITTDKHGRYSVPCAAIPDADIGSNFILKLDERTLPTGFSMTTENPEVVRLTAGKMAELNFGASLGREVSLELDGSAFIRGTVEMSPDLTAYLPSLVEILRQQRTTLRLTYRGDDSALSQARLDTVEDAIRSLWKQRGQPYALSVETGLELR